jgi:hypothetical protein
MRYVIGVDLAQTTDFAAFAVLSDDGRGHVDVRHLERAQNLPYTVIVKRIETLVRQLPGRPSLAVAATGVGRPVIDMIAAAGISAEVYPITLTGGATVVSDGRERRVPKRDVARALATLLESGRLKVARNLAEAQVLQREFLGFQVKVSSTGHDSYEARHGDEHDDLVLAVGLAAWLLENDRIRRAKGLPATTKEG